MRWLGLLGWLVGCGTCPQTACTGWVQLQVAPEVWETGTYELTVEGEGVAAHCWITVQDGATAPRSADVRCDHVVDRQAWVLDSGGPVAGWMRVAVPASSATVGATAQVRVTRDGQGVLDGSLALELVEVLQGTGTSCVSRCDGGVLSVSW